MEVSVRLSFSTRITLHLTEIEVDPSSLLPAGTMTAALTTAFTQPPECMVPFMSESACREGTECGGTYVPHLCFPFSGGAQIRCLPATSTDGDGVEYAVYNYGPGLFCPGGMTANTRTGSVIVCCPTGLSYSGDGQQGICTGTMTAGMAVVGFEDGITGTVFYSTSFFSADHTTVNVEAHPVYLNAAAPDTEPTTSDNTLNPPSSTVIDAPDTIRISNSTKASTSSESSTLNETSNSSKTSPSNMTTCRESGCQSTSPAPNPSSSSNKEGGNHTGRIVGVGIGGTIAVGLLVLGCFLLIRYRWKRLRNRHQAAPHTTLNGSKVEAELRVYKKRLPPELAGSETRAELEGTQVEEGGAGIYAWKPELEGTAGIRGSKNVDVRKKAELEANNRNVLARASGAGTEATPTTPVAGPSSASPRYPESTAAEIQTWI